VLRTGGFLHGEASDSLSGSGWWQRLCSWVAHPFSAEAEKGAAVDFAAHRFARPTIGTRLISMLGKEVL